MKLMSLRLITQEGVTRSRPRRNSPRTPQSFTFVECPRKKKSHVHAVSLLDSYCFTHELLPHVSNSPVPDPSNRFTLSLMFSHRCLLASHHFWHACTRVSCLSTTTTTTASFSSTNFPPYNHLFSNGHLFKARENRTMADHMEDVLPGNRELWSLLPKAFAGIWFRNGNGPSHESWSLCGLSSTSLTFDMRGVRLILYETATWEPLPPIC